ncbi:MAG: AAA family ATPase [Gammaproteobacteria bacterium]|nr:AAA family ATPase [Gammaproteobacteria bacterium]
MGDDTEIRLDSLTRDHLSQYHRMDQNSEFYFQPFKSNRFWVSLSYPSSGLQAINTQTFNLAFLHSKNTTEWGFINDYIPTIRGIIDDLGGYSPPSLAALAVWIGKDSRWEKGDNIRTIIQKFKKDFNLTTKEISKLFNTFSMPPEGIKITTKNRLDLKSVAHRFEVPPDASSQTEGALSSIRLRNVGPGKDMFLEFGERLTLIAGDNGLGKSFLLDGAWWSLTGEWAGRPAYPIIPKSKELPRIDFKIMDSSLGERTGGAQYLRRGHNWVNLKKSHRPSVAALSIYARVDGSFAVADETRGKLQIDNSESLNLFKVHEVWEGKTGQIEGLIRDWVSWQLTNERGQFTMLSRVLEHLSPEDIGPLEPSNPIRMPGEPRLIPTIKHPYGDVPVVFASAGVKRILLLAYLIIWSWQEHKLASDQAGVSPYKKMVIVIDEVEAHLHPKWQRLVLPALMSVGKLLNEELDVQVIASTHSPMVLASVENDFSTESDVLAHLSLKDDSVCLEKIEFYKYGDMSSWLISPVFGLSHARSRQAEKVINDAKKLQLSDDILPKNVRQITHRLKQVLSPDDTFWSRWLYFARQHGDDI